MNTVTPSVVATVTQEKSAATDRFQCTDVYQLWADGRITIDHCIEDEEWGGLEETREITEAKNLPQDFFIVGMSRVIEHGGSIRDEPL